MAVVATAFRAITDPTAFIAIGAATAFTATAVKIISAPTAYRLRQLQQVPVFLQPQQLAGVRQLSGV